METKICFKCGKEKPVTDFYRHSQMADGYLNKCKECTKRDEHERYMRNIENPEYVDKERERGREKYRRLYADLHKPSSHKENSNTRRDLAKRGIELKGWEVHHWNYNLRRDVFILTPRQHKKAHAGLVFDADSGCFSHNGVILDTYEKHRDYLQETIGAEPKHITF